MSPNSTVRGVSQEYQDNNHNMFAEDLAQTKIGSLVVALSLVSVSPYELYLADSVGHALMVQPTTLAPRILPPHLL